MSNDCMNNYELHNTDCLNLSTTPVDLVYLDPPYSCKSEDSYYGVEQNIEDFVSYMRNRLQLLSTLMKPDANILVHMDYKAVHYIKVEMDKIFGRDNFRNEIIWCYSNPSQNTRYLPRKHNTILWYGMGKYTFNSPRIPYTSSLKVGGKTGWKQSTDTTSYLEKGKLLEDWWTDIPALCRNEPEKTGYATQKPNKLMQRIVEVYSNEGDRVLDPFCGSGSTLEACARLGRFPVGCDINPAAIELSRSRLDCIVNKPKLTDILDGS